MELRFNYILSIIACLLGFYAGDLAYRFSIFSSDLAVYAILTIVFSLLGLIGIYFFEKDYKKTIAIYVIAGILIIFMLSIDAALFSCILYIVAALVAYYEAKKNPQLTDSINNNQEVHYFGEQQDFNQQSNFTQVENNGFNKKLLIISLAVIIVILLLAIGLVSTDNGSNLNVSNVNIVSQGYSMYTVSCDLVPNKDYSYLEMVVVFYDSTDSVVGKSSLVWNVNNPVKGQLIKVSGTALTSSANAKPTRAELLFFDKAFSSNPQDALYSVNVTMQ